MSIKKILELSNEGKTVQLKGWVRFNRSSKKIGFLEIFDGSTLNGIQVVYKAEKLNDEKTFKFLQSLPIFSAIDFTIELVKNNKNNVLEGNLLKINEFALATENNPLQRKTHSHEFLREIAHLRPKTKTFQSIFKIRSLIMFALHSFFNEQGFIYVNSPILTSNDAEGAGETFKVVTNDKKEFFTNSVSLSVSGQLQAESFAQSFTKVYTLAPTFRAENSNTQKHASEFWMLEPEIAFADYNEVMDLSAEMLAYVANYLNLHAKEYIDFLTEQTGVDLGKRISILMDKKIKKIKYEKAIEILKEHKEQFEVQDIEFGLDLSTEHEKFLATFYEDSIVYIYDYPKTIKAFYMKQNDDQKTVRGFDLIIPEIGELIGGSERENDFEKILTATKANNIDMEELSWYLDLRKEGYLKSTGFGLGIERLVMYLTGTKNIRDVLPFPRTPGNILY